MENVGTAMKLAVKRDPEVVLSLEISDGNVFLIATMREQETTRRQIIMTFRPDGTVYRARGVLPVFGFSLNEKGEIQDGGLCWRPL